MKQHAIKSASKLPIQRAQHIYIISLQSEGEISAKSNNLAIGRIELTIVVDNERSNPLDSDIIIQKNNLNTAVWCISDGRDT